MSRRLPHASHSMEKSDGRRSVFITGVSSGIGKALALQLLAEGFHVIGTVRRPADGRYLQAAGGDIVVLDLTDSKQINRVAPRVERLLQGRTLAALVSNAGLSVCVSWEDIAMDELRHQMEVNFFGAVAVTKQLLPLIRAGHGRIVLVSSTSARLPLALMGAYCASKFALEAFAVTLRQELYREKIPVTCVQPGSTRTPIFEKTRGMLQSRHGDQIARGAYAPFLKENRYQEIQGLAPETVARGIAKLIRKKRPPRQIVISKQAWLNYLFPFVPQALMDALVCPRLFPHPQRNVQPK